MLPLRVLVFFLGPLSPVSLLKDLKHANIVCLHDIIHTHQSLTLIFEYVVSLWRPPNQHLGPHWVTCMYRILPLSSPRTKT